MLARLHHYEELEQHVSFFKDWFGNAWASALREHIGTSHSEIDGVLAHRKSFSKTLLPRLRKLRSECMNTVVLAKPSHAFDAAYSGPRTRRDI